MPGHGPRLVGQRGCCLNERLREHNTSLRAIPAGYLAVHARAVAGYTPEPSRFTVVETLRDRRTMEICEAFEIKTIGRPLRVVTHMFCCPMERRVFLEDGVCGTWLWIIEDTSMWRGIGEVKDLLFPPLDCRTSLSRRLVRRLTGWCMCSAYGVIVCESVSQRFVCLLRDVFPARFLRAAATAI